MDRHHFLPRCGELEPREGKRSHLVTVMPKGLGSPGFPGPIVQFSVG